MDYNLNQRIRGPPTDSIKVHVVFDKKNFQSFPNISLGKTCDPNTEPFLPQGFNLKKLSKCTLGEQTYQITRFYVLWFQIRRFFMHLLYKPL